MRIIKEDIDFWLEIYSTEIVQRQMCAAPETVDGLWDYLQPRAFTVWHDDERIGGFTIEDNDRTGTFGLVMHPKYLDCGYGDELIRLIEETAWELGIRTLRADVYQDNFVCMKLLRGAGFRTLAFMEKNISSLYE